MFLKSDPPDLFLRFFAKGADLALGIALCFLIRPFGTVVGILYILLADGLVDGSSPMKWLVGLRTHDKGRGRSGSFKSSVLRNLPFGLTAAMLLIPVLGVVLAAILGVFFTILESYFLYSDPDHMRLGDVLADTTVVRERPLRKLGKKAREERLEAARLELVEQDEDEDDADAVNS